VEGERIEGAKAPSRIGMFSPQLTREFGERFDLPGDPGESQPATHFGVF